MISSNSHHVLVLKNDGTVVGWGNNGEGQLGDAGGGEPGVITGLSNDNYQLVSQYHFSMVSYLSSSSALRPLSPTIADKSNLEHD